MVLHLVLVIAPIADNVFCFIDPAQRMSEWRKKPICDSRRSGASNPLFATSAQAV